jgi:hypothetical protein
MIADRRREHPMKSVKYPQIGHIFANTITITLPINATRISNNVTQSLIDDAIAPPSGLTHLGNEEKRAGAIGKARRGEYGVRHGVRYNAAE